MAGRHYSERCPEGKGQFATGFRDSLGRGVGERGRPWLFSLGYKSISKIGSPHDPNRVQCTTAVPKKCPCVRSRGENRRFWALGTPWRHALNAYRVIAPEIFDPATRNAPPPSAASTPKRRPTPKRARHNQRGRPASHCLVRARLPYVGLGMKHAFAFPPNKKNGAARV